jgi:hypothetical protein
MMTRLLAVVCVFAALTGCAARTSVGHILHDPHHYQNRDVLVQGVVTTSVNAMVAGGYRLDDGTGTITVISNGGAPRKGARVQVRGRVSTAVSVLGQNFGTTIQERDRKVAR